jgi:hypothetical protein
MNMRMRSVLSHSAQAIAEGSLIAVLVVGALAGTAFAARGGGGGHHTSGTSSNLSVAMVTDWNSDGAPNWNDEIHFTITTSNTYPVVSVSCTQSGTVVYGDSHPYYWPNVWDDNGNFVLASLAWSAGAADCTATLKGTSNGKTVTLGSMSFQAGA